MNCTYLPGCILFKSSILELWLTFAFYSQVNNAMKNPTSFVWAPELFIQQVFHHARNGENKSLLIHNMNNMRTKLENNSEDVAAMVSSSCQKHKQLQSEHTEDVWNKLDLVSNKGSSMHFELKTDYRRLLEHYKDFTIFKKANFIVLTGQDGKTGTISYWMSLWDESSSFLKYRKGLSDRNA